MAWSLNNSSDWTTVSNDRMATCSPCIYMFPDIYVAGLAGGCLLSLPLRIWALRLLASSAVRKIDLLAINLIVSDLLLTLVSLFTMLDEFLLQTVFPYMWSFLFSLVVIGRPLFQCCICLERYLAVEHPIAFIKYRALRYRAAMLAPMWFSVLTICFVAVALCETLREVFTRLIIFQCSILLFILAITSFSSFSILRALRRPPPGDGKADRQLRGRKEGNRVNRKAFIICLLIHLYTVVCYLPLAVLVFSDHVWGEQWFCSVYMINLWHALLVSFVFCFHHLRNMGKLSWRGCHKDGHNV